MSLTGFRCPLEFDVSPRKQTLFHELLKVEILTRLNVEIVAEEERALDVTEQSLWKCVKSFTESRSHQHSSLVLPGQSGRESSHCKL